MMMLKIMSDFFGFGNCSSRRIVPAEINKQEEFVIQTLLGANVLVSLNGMHFTDKEETVLVCCPDGSKLRYIFRLLLKMYSSKAKKRGIFFHTLTRHGGPLCLSQDLKFDPCHRESLIKEIVISVNDLGYRSFNLVAHFPCAMARKMNISPWHVVDALANAKKTIKEAVQKETGEKVTVACHLHSGNGVLFFLYRGRFKDWKKKHPIYF